MSLPDKGPCVRTISTAADSRFRSDPNVADTSANAREHVFDVSDALSGTAPGMSATLSGPDPHRSGVMVALFVAGLLCVVRAWVVPDALSEWDRVSDTALGTA